MRGLGVVTDNDKLQPHQVLKFVMKGVFNNSLASMNRIKLSIYSKG